MTTSTHRHGPTRRTVAKGAAWTVPTLLVGAELAQASASPGGTVVGLGTGCKDPGASVPGYPKAYEIQATITNPPGGDNAIVVPVSFTMNGVPAPDYVALLGNGNCTINCAGTTCQPTVPSGSICVKAGTSVNVTLVGGEYKNSSNGTAVFTYNVLNASTCCLAVEGSTNEVFSATVPPCK